MVSLDPVVLPALHAAPLPATTTWRARQRLSGGKTASRYRTYTNHSCPSSPTVPLRHARSEQPRFTFISEGNPLCRLLVASKKMACRRIRFAWHILLCLVKNKKPMHFSEGHGFQHPLNGPFLHGRPHALGGPPKSSLRGCRVDAFRGRFSNRTFGTVLSKMIYRQQHEIFLCGFL
jgi:hypothetical protein